MSVSRRTIVAGGVGSLGHLSAARPSRELNVERVHVPYKGNSLAIESMLRGDTDLLFGAVLDVLALARSGELTLLAVTLAERVPTLPNVPTMLELGHAGLTATLWYAYDVPAGTPQDVIDVLATAIAKAAAHPGLQAQFAGLGVIVRLTPGPAFARFMREELERWKKVIVENNIKAEE
jgi:tripartite-type tricarboxylate transporter receptor subunit TctC